MNVISSFRSVRFALALALSLHPLLLSIAARGQVATNISIETLSGKHAPGTPSNFTWDTFGGAAIADDGEISFRAFLNDHAGGLQQIGIWRGSAGNYSLVARSEDTAPGAGTGAKFDEPFAPAIRAANGSAPKPLAFYATINTGTSSVGSIWSVVNGTLTKIALVGDPAPGGQTYQSFFQKEIFSADDGSPVFVGSAAGLRSIWYSSGGTVGLSVQDGQSVPGSSPGTFQLIPQSVVAAPGGLDPKISFLSNITNGPLIEPGLRRGVGLFLARFGEAPAALHLQGDNAPGIPGAYLNSFQDYDINAVGDVAYVATLGAFAASPGAVDSTNDTAVFLNANLLARRGGPSPISGFKFDGFDGLVVNDAGKVAFQGGVIDASNNTLGVVCTADGANLVVIAATGDEVPTFEGTGITFTGFGSVSTGRLQMNKSGQVLFLGFDSLGGRGLYCTDRDGILQLVARSGDPIEVAPDDNRTISTINFLNNINIGSGGRDGRARALNDAGQVIFGLRFDDGSTAIGRGTAGAGGSSVSGNTSANHISSTTTSDPINTFSGELFDLEKTDLNLGGPMPLVFERYRGSMIESDGNITSALGRNRLHNFDAKLTFPDATNATVVLSDGRVAQFTKAGNVWTLAGRKDIAFQLVQSGANFIFADPRSQRRWTFDGTSGQLTKIEDGRGNAHTLTYTGAQLTSVSDGLGRTLAFSYDGSGNLVKVRDPVADAPNPAVREVNFTYNGSDLASAIDSLMHTTSYTYDGSGHLLSTQDPRSNSPYSQTYASARVATQTEHPAMGVAQTTSLAYDTVAHTTTITDPVAARSHSYTATGELKELKDEADKSITFTPDPTGRRSTVTDQLGRTVTITYHAPSGKPASIRAEDGATTTFGYKARVVSGITFFDLVKVTYPDGTSRSFTYDAKGNLITAVDQLGKKATFTYDGHGQLLTAVDPAGGVATFTYAPATGNLATSKDSDTGETTYTFDEFSRLTRVTHPDGEFIVIEYDDADNVTAITDERGKRFTYTHDPNDNLTVVTDPTTATTQLGYDALDRVNQLTDRLSKTRSITFDSRDLLASETDELNHVTTVIYDSRRRVSAVSEPGGAATGFGYDDVGRLTSITDALMHTSTLARNSRGSVIATSDALGHTALFERDALQRIIRLIDPVGRKTSLTYDKRSLLTAATRDGTGAANYTRDAAGRIVKIVDPNHSAWSFTYTPAGRLKSSKDPLGRIISFSYNPMTGRLASVALPDGGTCMIERDEAGEVTRLNYTGAPGGPGPDLHFGYDALRRVTSATTGVATNDLTLARDAEGQITTSSQGGVNFTAAYDAAGRLITAGYAGALTVTYTYDLNDRLTNVTDTLSGATVGFGYDAAGRLISLTRSNSVNATFGYDAADRLIRIQDGPAANPIDLKFTLDAAGDITATDITAPLLLPVVADTKQFKFDSASQVKADGYAYDARGRLTALPAAAAGGGAHTFTWDAASRLISLDTTTLVYDAFGDVATRTADGATTRMFYHHAIGGHPLVAERNETTNQFTRFYVWTPGGVLLYAIDASSHAPSFYHFDRIGSTLALTDSAGLLTDKYAYTPYGELLGHEAAAGQTPSTQPFTFVGAFGIRSEGPLYQMRARYYDPLTARFLSRDPGGAQLADPRALDPYLYALGNPTRYVDVTGAAPSLNDNGIARDVVASPNLVAALAFLVLPEEARADDYVIYMTTSWIKNSQSPDPDRPALAALIVSALAFQEYLGGEDTPASRGNIPLILAGNGDLFEQTRVQQPSLPEAEVFRRKAKPEELVNQALAATGLDPQIAEPPLETVGTSNSEIGAAPMTRGGNGKDDLKVKGLFGLYYDQFFGKGKSPKKFKKALDNAIEKAKQAAEKEKNKKAVEKEKEKYKTK
jgi:RHS repeat-associated protein